MSSYNKVILMGNLTRDPELRYTSNQTAICKFGLAVNRRFKDAQSGEWKEEPTFIDVTIFGARAEPFARYHTKGKPAFIEGSLRLDTWDDKNGGGKRSKLYVVADTWEVVGAGRGEQGGSGNTGSMSSGGNMSSDGSTPSGSGMSGGSGMSSGSGRATGGGGGSMSSGDREPEYLSTDDTPF
jgi:single-strand DNA-binding protein